MAFLEEAPRERRNMQGAVESVVVEVPWPLLLHPLQAEQSLHSLDCYIEGLIYLTMNEKEERLLGPLSVEVGLRSRTHSFLFM